MLKQVTESMRAVNIQALPPIINEFGYTINRLINGEGSARVVATANLPAAGASMDGAVLIEDAGAGDRNLIIYAGGERFRIDGGAAF